MNEPKPFDNQWALDLVSWIVAGVIAGLGAASLWFRESKRRIYQRITDIENSMVLLKDSDASHREQMAVLRTCQANIEDNLQRLEKSNDDTNKKLDKIYDYLLNGRGNKQDR